MQKRISSEVIAFNQRKLKAISSDIIEGLIEFQNYKFDYIRQLAASVI